MQARAKQLKCESSRGKGEGGEWQKNTKQCQHGRWQSLYSTAQAHLCTCTSNKATHSTGIPLPPRQSLSQTSHICATSRAPPAQTAAGSLADRHSLHVVVQQLLSCPPCEPSPQHSAQSLTAHCSAGPAWRETPPAHPAVPPSYKTPARGRVHKAVMHNQHFVCHAKRIMQCMLSVKEGRRNQQQTDKMDDGFVKYGAYIICACDVSDMTPVPECKALNIIPLTRCQKHTSWRQLGWRATASSQATKAFTTSEAQSQSLLVLAKLVCTAALSSACRAQQPGDMTLASSSFCLLRRAFSCSKAPAQFLRERDLQAFKPTL